MSTPERPATRLPGIARAAGRVAVRAIRPEGPITGPMATVLPEDAERLRRILDLTLRVSETLLGSGASANDTVDAALRLMRAYGLRGVHVDVTFTSITLSVHGGPTREPMTVLRVVRARSIDYTRLLRLEQLIRDAEEGLAVEAARERYDRIMVAPPAYRRWVVTAANGLLAGGVCLLFAASPIIAVVAMVASALIDRLQAAVLRRRLPPFFAQALGAAIPTLAAGVLMAGIMAGVPWLQGVRPSLVVAAGVVLMLSGLSTVGAAQDAIDGFYVTAGARSFEVMMMTLGIIVGIVAVLQVLGRAGVDLSVSTASPTMGPVPLQLVGAVVIAATFAISTYAGPRTVVLCALMGALGWLGYLGAAALGFGDISSSGLGATASGFVATLLARRLAVPALALTTSAVVPLMPGSMIFRGLLQLVRPDAGDTALAQGFVTLLSAASIGVALAAGVSLGTYLARPVAARRTRTRRPRAA